MITRNDKSSDNRGRAHLEFYTTPPEATKALLSVEEFDGTIWEPACGNGAISKVLIDADYSVISTDLAFRNYGKGGIDFLRSDKSLAKNIVTNPPYGTHGLADAFIKKALNHTYKTGGKVAMLLNLRSLCNPKRNNKYINYPPASIYVIAVKIVLENENTVLALTHT